MGSLLLEVVERYGGLEGCMGSLVIGSGSGSMIV
jgi:hypothetical protein